MLTFDEKRKVREILSDGLGLKSNIRLAYYLDSVHDTKEDVQILKSKLDDLLYNQRVINDKLDKILTGLKR